MINRKLVLAARPEGLIKDSDFDLAESPVPGLKDGEVLIKTLYLSLAPIMKFYMLDGAGVEAPLGIGDTMRGRGVGEIIDSKNSSYKPGDIVQGKFGWQEYVISDAAADKMLYKVPDNGLSPSTALGVLGMTGYTSYFGLYDVGELKADDKVLVSAAAGGVGSIVGGLAKIKGAEAIGLSSKDEKCEILKNKLNYANTINYRTENLDERLKELFPDGIDVYFDNVGGEVLDTVLGHLNRYARVICCGRISTYTDAGLKSNGYSMKNWHMIFATRSKMEGFFIYDYQKRFPEAYTHMAKWISEGKLKYHEDVLQGLESMPQALNRLFEGKNVGKQLVKIS